MVVKTNDGEVLVKELKRRTTKALELSSLNPEHADRTVPTSDVGLDGPHHVGQPEASPRVVSPLPAARVPGEVTQADGSDEQSAPAPEIGVGHAVQYERSERRSRERQHDRAGIDPERQLPRSGS